jgi:DNA-binding NtrC family response regulator
MAPDLSHITSSAHFPRILIAESNLCTAESLVQTIKDERLDIDYEVCFSHDRAVIKLFRSPPPYQLVISSIPVAERDDFFLLKHNRALQPDVPFMLTAGPANTASVHRAIQEGAFDLIPTSLEPEQTARIIRLALWHNKFKGLIAAREMGLEKFRQHLAAYPEDWKKDEALQRAVQHTLSVVARSIEKIETLVSLSRLAAALEQHTRSRALDRLGNGTLWA